MSEIKISDKKPVLTCISDQFAEFVNKFLYFENYEMGRRIVYPRAFCKDERNNIHIIGLSICIDNSDDEFHDIEFSNVDVYIPALPGYVDYCSEHKNEMTNLQQTAINFLRDGSVLKKENRFLDKKTVLKYLNADFFANMLYFGEDVLQENDKFDEKFYKQFFDNI